MRPREKTSPQSRFKVGSPAKGKSVSPSKYKANNITTLRESNLKQNPPDESLIHFNPNKKRGAPFSFKLVPDVEEIEDAVTQRKRQRAEKKHKPRKRRKLNHSSDSLSISTPSYEAQDSLIIRDTPLLSCTADSASFSSIRPRKPSPSPKETPTCSMASVNDTESLFSCILQERDSLETSLSPEISVDKLDRLTDGEKNKLIISLFEENKYCRRRISDLTHYLQSAQPNKFKART